MDNTDQLEQVVNSITTNSESQFYTLDELMKKFGIANKKQPDLRPRGWYRFLPKPFRVRAEKYGIAALRHFTVIWLSLVSLVISLAFGMYSDATANIISFWLAFFILFGFVGGLLGLLVGGMNYTDETKKTEKSSSDKKMIIYNHCQSLIDDYREEALDENSEMIKTEARLKKDVEKVNTVIGKIESFLTDPEIKLTAKEERDCRRQLSDAEKLKKGRKTILKAHNKTKRRFLDYLKGLEKKLARVDISISLTRVENELIDLKEETDKRLDESEEAFMKLLTSFAGDIQNLQNAIENLQVFSQASFEVETNSSEPKVLMSNGEKLMNLNDFIKDSVHETEAAKPKSIPVS